jgi:DNA-binding beta-propeller fold protein YncE
VVAVALDPDGNAIFGLSRPDATTDCFNDVGQPNGCVRLQTRTRSAEGALSAVQSLSAPGRHANFTHVAVDEDGNAVFVWESYDYSTDCGGSACYRIEARARSAAGVLSPVQQLAAGTEVGGGVRRFFSPQVAVDPDGNAVFVWERITNRHGLGHVIQTRARSVDGTLSAVQNLSPPGHSAEDPYVALDSDGNAVFAWARFDRDPRPSCGGDGCPRIQTRTRSAAGALSAVQTLSPSGKPAGEGRVAVDTHGNAAFVWRASDGTLDRVQTRARSKKGTLSPLRWLSSPGQPAGDGMVGLDSHGNAVYSWLRVDGRTDCSDPSGNRACTRVQTRVRSKKGALSTVQTLSSPGRSASNPQLTVDRDGNAVFAWQRSDCFNGSCYNPQARTRSAAGALSAVQALSYPSVFPTSFAGLVGNARGDAVAAWNSFDGTYSRGEAAFGP